MKVLLIDGHPDAGRLTTHLLDTYAAALPASAEVTRVAVRDLAFTPVLAHGYRQRTEWEPDLHRLAERLDACDHLAVAFPMWRGAEPAPLKGLIDRLFLPGFAFAYHKDDPWWDRLMEGRSADLIATMDTPPFILWLWYGNALLRRWKGQVLGFCGFAPVRTLKLGPVGERTPPRNLARWEARVARLARTVRQKVPHKKQPRLAAFLRKEVTP
ncbi:NAD(P)H-dependent oxidoreductase [Erythrobacter sp. WG]|uniref:NAD(P)H-dependent oxidoreductase n=1 Tax=Erythrobacter sp. WG TaxID=2985510 RepID=UPI0022706FC3|nr:NAD(P)H-dependent oxidoreductase [Erythrobacter sp. WG]MCX9146139.1 NAD(P)H-dependent oxidoreductase [Erythrobacter sp. WG]